MANINRVTITGNLTRDPELRALPSGTAVCELGVAVNHRRKDQSDQWVDEPNYFNVVVFGAQGQNCAQYLSKGRPVAVDGRLRWSSWEDKNGGGKRSKVEIIANVVQFLGSREDGGNQGGGQQRQQQSDHVCSRRLRSAGPRHVGLRRPGGRVVRRWRRTRRRHPVLGRARRIGAAPIRRGPYDPAPLMNLIANNTGQAR